MCDENEGDMMFDKDTMLHYHLTSNHYPPLPVGLIPFAKRAIELAQDEEWDLPVRVGEGTLRDGDRIITVSEVVEGMHLWGFVGEPCEA